MGAGGIHHPRGSGAGSLATRSLFAVVLMDERMSVLDGLGHTHLIRDKLGRNRSDPSSPLSPTLPHQGGGCKK